MKMFLVLDNTAGDINKLCNEQGLIDYANQAHFVKGADNFDSTLDNDCCLEPCTDIDGAIAILGADLFRVETIEVSNNESFIFDLSTVALSQPNQRV